MRGRGGGARIDDDQNPHALQSTGALAPRRRAGAAVAGVHSHRADRKVLHVQDVAPNRSAGAPATCRPRCELRSRSRGPGAGPRRSGRRRGHQGGDRQPAQPGRRAARRGARACSLLRSSALRPGDAAGASGRRAPRWSSWSCWRCRSATSLTFQAHLARLRGADPGSRRWRCCTCCSPRRARASSTASADAAPVRALAELELAAAGPGCGRPAATPASARCRPGSAISVWVMLSTKRSSRIRRSRSGSPASSGRAGPRLDQLEPLVDDADDRVVGRIAAVRAQRGQRHAGVAASDVERLDHLVDRCVDALRQLGDRRRAAEFLGQVGAGGRDRRLQLLRAARHPQQPAEVAEVPLDLAEDRRGGVGRELQPALGVEAVDRLDQADRADLDQIGQRLVAPGEAPGQVLDQRQVQLDQPVADRVRRAAGASGAEFVQLARAGRVGLGSVPRPPARTGAGSVAAPRRLHWAAGLASLGQR